jgi:hypothetical protein
MDEPKIILPDTPFREILEEAELRTDPWRRKVRELTKHINSVEDAHKRMVDYIYALEKFIVNYTDRDELRPKDAEFVVALWKKHYPEEVTDVSIDS